jgi:hypothetical protein
MKVVVLSDGETYTEIIGCRVMRIPDSTPEEDYDQYVKSHYEDLSSVPVIDLVCFKHIHGGSK